MRLAPCLYPATQYQKTENRGQKTDIPAATRHALRALLYALCFNIPLSHLLIFSPSYLLTFAPSYLLTFLPSYLLTFLPSHLLSFPTSAFQLPTSSKLPPLLHNSYIGFGTRFGRFVELVCRFFDQRDGINRTRRHT